MSIVISILQQNGVYLFGDKKITFHLNGFPIQHSLITTKVFQLNDSLLCGITGDANFGNSIVQKLKTMSNEKPSAMIDIIENFNDKFNDHSTFILSGKYDNGLYFHYGYKTDGKKSNLEFKSSCMIALNNDNQDYSISDFYYDRIDEGFSIEDSCIKTIKYASEIDFENISEEYDYFKIID